ncbi:uncharacterized protein LOC105686257 isoform X2 [Athalia rosae]|uniref:uncharacterized protein LOC105686257 isoform X2 n=1 Tax=Athalia rosae TaxID=37344 RepID=UPI0006252722|nr:uncharacterized protein LOC105686257 isoform X2 [Athalia rosae]
MDFHSVILQQQTHSHNDRLINSETLTGITSGCILILLKSLQRLSCLTILDNFLKIKVTNIFLEKCAIFWSTLASISNESKLPEILIDQKVDDDQISDRIDLNNVGTVTGLFQHAGKNKKGGKKANKDGKDKSKREREERAAKREKEEEERLKDWNSEWNKKLEAKEALNEVPCCSAKGLFPKPKTQSNIWIKVTQDKKIQDVQMAFMHVPVPKPKPPPLPKLITIESPELEPVGKIKKKGNGKKKKTKK